MWFQKGEERVEAKKAGQRRFLGLRKNGFCIGIVVCLVLSVLFSGIFRFLSASLRQSGANFTAHQNEIYWLYMNNYLLYRDLYNLETGENLAYEDLYLEGLSAKIQEFNNLGATENEEAPEYKKMCAVWELTDRFFEILEAGYPFLNQYFDYMIVDTETGEYLTNTASSANPGISTTGSALYLSFSYDENGKVQLLEPIVGSSRFLSAETLRKTAGEIARGGRLSDLIARYIGIPAENYVSLEAPRNCRIIYRLGSQVLEEMKEDTSLASVVYGEDNFLFGPFAFQELSADEVYLVADRGGYQTLSVFLLAALFLALFLPGIDPGGSRHIRRFCRPPLELLLVLVLFLLPWEDGILRLEYTVSGHLLAEGLASALPDAAGHLMTVNPGAERVCEFLIHYFLLCLYFMIAWYMGICLRAVRRQGLKGYLREKSLAVRLCVWLCEKCRGVYAAASRIDLTLDARKMILKVVLFNALILFGISCLWFGGIALVIVYSVILYLILKKYVSDIQKKYGILLSATNQIAEGNLNVAIPEDLGVFEPFKPQIYRIEEGFRRAVEEETKSQRMKSELITNVSHDLKTPLTAIITYVDLLKREDLTTEQRQEYLATLERKSLRLKVLIEDLFEISKANSQTMPLHPVEVELGSLVKQAAFELEESFQEAGLELRMRLPEERIECLLDSQRTYRIFENLFGNIAKYALHGTRVYVECESEGDSAAVVLKNIAANEILVRPEELAERFVRGDAARGTEGNGLGLAIAKSFAEIQGGRLSVEVDGDLFKVTVVFPRKT